MMMMKRILITLIFGLNIVNVEAQQSKILEGTVTYKSSNSIYVRFSSTDNINIGDTLYFKTKSEEIPALIINHKSSISVVCAPISTMEININDKIFKKMSEEKVIQNQDSSIIKKNLVQLINTPDSITNVEIIPAKKSELSKTQVINGRISLSTNASFNPGENNNFQRMRAAFSLNVTNINNSPLSIQSYLTYRHRYGIDQVNSAFKEDFKTYTLAVNYNPGDKINLWVGRKINNNIANIGAIDGIQYEYKFKNLISGVFAGTRPDYIDYSFNLKLLQIGGYLSHQPNPDKGYLQTTLAFAEQRNDGNTDRRFLYFQHINNRIKHLNVFFSSELDMYQKIDQKITNKLELTSIYLSVRYRFQKNLSISASYDKRRNIIYYESFQTFIDQLLAQETRQGLRFQVTYSPFKFMSVNASQFLRYQGDGSKPTTNTLVNISFLRMPFKNSSASLSINTLATQYHKAVIFGGRITQNVFKGKAQVELNYRNVNYNYSNTETSQRQNIIGVNLNMNVLKYTSFIISYEGTYEKEINYQRYFITLIQRLKSKKK